eukprot:1178280-Prorocentrum_minimum.AAC.4
MEQERAVVVGVRHSPEGHDSWHGCWTVARYVDDTHVDAVTTSPTQDTRHAHGASVRRHGPSAGVPSVSRQVFSLVY